MRALQAAVMVLVLFAVGSAAFGRHYRVVVTPLNAPVALIAQDPWPGPGSRILVVAPHPDDETLGGEMVLREAAVRNWPARVVLVTCGDGFKIAAAGAFGHPATRREMVTFGQMRQAETLHAMRALGLSRDHVVFLGFPDGGIDRLWATNWTPDHPWKSRTTGVDRVPYSDALRPGAPYCGQALLSELEEELREFRPTDIYVSHPRDQHPDHWAVNLFVVAALHDLGSQPWTRNVRLHPYLVHAGPRFPWPHGYHPGDVVDPPVDMRLHALDWSELSLTAGQAAYRKNLIDLYKTQVARTAPFLEAFARRNVLFGDVPAFEPRQVSSDSPDQVRWTRRDEFYNRLHSAKNAVDRQQAVWCPSGLAIRIALTQPARGTVCRLLIHPLTRPPEEGRGLRIAARGMIPLQLGTRLIQITSTAERDTEGGVRRYEQGDVLTLVLPRSLFQGSDRAYLGFVLIHNRHLMRFVPWREFVVPA